MAESRDYPERPIVGVGAVVVKADALLLIRRGQPPRYGEWSVPGGVVELGETLQEAIQREVLEECGIEIAVGRVLDAVDIIQRDADGRVQFHYVVVDWGALYARGELRAASDVLEARWVPYAQIGSYELNPRTHEVIAKAFV